MANGLMTGEAWPFWPAEVPSHTPIGSLSRGFATPRNPDQAVSTASAARSNHRQLLTSVASGGNGRSDGQHHSDVIAPVSMEVVANWPKHLIYHLYPVLGSVWRENINELRKRIALFTGSRIISVVFDGTTESRDIVLAELADLNADVRCFDNNRRLGETVSLLPAMQQTLAQPGVTFYAHAKGVTHRDSSVVFGIWARRMYSLLDRFDEVSQRLTRVAFCGLVRATGQPIAEGRHEWHYPGSFFWFRNDVVAQRGLSVDRYDRFLPEQLPSHIARFTESAALHPDVLHANPYLAETWQHLEVSSQPMPHPGFGATFSQGRSSLFGRPAPGLPFTSRGVRTEPFRMEGTPPPSVDVVITSHNYGRFLEECLASVACTGQLIVVDDASDPTDETKAICVRRGVRYLRTEFKSPHLARGAGFAACSSPLVQFLDADNTLRPGYLDSAARLFAANPRLAIVYSDQQLFGDDSSLLRTPDRFDSARLERVNFIDTGAVWRREAIQQINGFETDPSGWEDWYLARQIMRSGWWEAEKNPIPLNYRRHSGQRVQNPADKSYYATASLADETVTVFLTVSGRSHKNHGYFERHKQWLLKQTWPRNQVRILIANTSHRPLPPEWLAGLDGFAGVSWYDHPTGRPCLEDENRANSPLTELQVQTVVAAINNRMLREAQTEFVLSLENDVFPHALNAIEQLLRAFDHSVCAVTGAYRQRYEPQAWTVWDHMPPNGRPQLPVHAGHGVQPVYGSGFGCLLLRMSQVRDEVLTGQTLVSGYFDADWFDRLQKRGRQVRCNWDVRCEHGGIGVKLTILLPTVGRDTLKRTVQSIQRQLRDGDELWILADGEIDEESRNLAGGSVKVIQVEGGPHADWGHTPRNQILPTIKTGYVVHFDDDDIMATDALMYVRQAISRHNGDLLLFQMQRADGSLIPVGQELRRGNVGTPMFVHPANLKLATFEPVYGGDFDFISGTVTNNPDCQVRWVPHVICHIRHQPATTG